ncbi:MAG: toll/interleukin-1 receptor domain-containing protein [Proteobacteria bacterium]|nr:toll/interleukin-1 receptor domain-containing protein [Pseudomonadota bacterium]
MKIFISWSGTQSKRIALALRDWIPYVLQEVEPWMSTKDIDAGSRWGREIEKELENTDFAIICLTKENQNAPWILFEAGAVAKSMNESYVCPFLIDMAPADINQGPLSQFQSKKATVDDTRDLISAINNCLKEKALSEERLQKTFDAFWPQLKAILEQEPSQEIVEDQVRSVDSMSQEILEIVRSMAHESQEKYRILKLSGDIAFLRNMIPTYFSGVQKEIENIKSLNGETPRTASSHSRFCEIIITYPLLEGKYSEKMVTISSKDKVTNVLNRVWDILNSNSSFKPAPHTYLWDWIMIRKKDNLPLFIKGVQYLISAHEIFFESDEWEVLPIDEPALINSKRFGFEKGRSDKWS